MKFGIFAKEKAPNAPDAQPKPFLSRIFRSSVQKSNAPAVLSPVEGTFAGRPSEFWNMLPGSQPVAKQAPKPKVVVARMRPDRRLDELKYHMTKLADGGEKSEYIFERARDAVMDKACLSMLKMIKNGMDGINEEDAAEFISLALKSWHAAAKLEALALLDKFPEGSRRDSLWADALFGIEKYLHYGSHTARHREIFRAAVETRMAKMPADEQRRLFGLALASENFGHSYECTISFVLECMQKLPPGKETDRLWEIAAQTLEWRASYNSALCGISNVIAITLLPPHLQPPCILGALCAAGNEEHDYAFKLMAQMPDGLLDDAFWKTAMRDIREGIEKHEESHLPGAISRIPWCKNEEERARKVQEVTDKSRNGAASWATSQQCKLIRTGISSGHAAYQDAAAKLVYDLPDGKEKQQLLSEIGGRVAELAGA